MDVSVKVKHSIVRWSSNSIPGCILKRNEDTCLYAYVHMSVYSIFIRVKTRNNLHAHDLKNKQCGIAVRWNIWPFKKEWTKNPWYNIKIENIMLNKVYQSLKRIYFTIPLIWNANNSQIHRDRKYIRGFKALGEWAWVSFGVKTF